MRVVICGAGVIGASTAYHLSRRGAAVTVVERREVACAASGRSGAFLARDWSAGTPLDALARRSFDLHAGLPGQIEGDWGHHGVHTYAGHAYARDGGLVLTERLGTPDTTAIIHPRAFTEALMRAAQGHGAQLRGGEVTGVRGIGSTVDGVLVDGRVVEADAVVLAMGPWCLRAAAWLPLPGVYAEKGHSLVYATGSDFPPDALFLEYREEDGGVLRPEVFPRADGTTYVAGGSSQGALPADPADVAPDAGALERLEAACARISPALDGSRIAARQACLRPITQDGLPLIGPVTGLDGAYIASGHGVWGMLNAPATGEALAELILDGAAHSTDLAPFHPARLRALDPARLRSV
jgi:glycine/D-amino acid oxidase-like deaminating enzyme